MVLIRRRNCVVLMLANEGSQWERTYNTDFLCSHLGKIYKAYLQMKREAYDKGPESLQQDMVSSVSGDNCDFSDEGQEAAWSPPPCAAKATPVTCSAGYDGSVSLCNERQRYLITLLIDTGNW